MRLFILFILAFYFNNNVFAEVIDYKAIDLLKAYAKEIKSVAIDFKQTDSEGNTAEGKLLIDKPFKFRCNYYAPFPLVIIGNKNYLSVYDYEMEEVSRVNANENIFRFLLMDDVEIEKYFDIEKVISKSKMIKFVLYHRESDKRSIVVFDERTKQITQMEIVEGASITSIKFDQAVQVGSFNSDLFILKNPDTYGAPARLTKHEIETKYKILK